MIITAKQVVDTAHLVNAETNHSFAIKAIELDHGRQNRDSVVASSFQST
jgi:hypothetical protein